jgi:hypothetical protein
MWTSSRVGIKSRKGWGSTCRAHLSQSNKNSEREVVSSNRSLSSRPGNNTRMRRIWSLPESVIWKLPKPSERGGIRQKIFNYQLTPTRTNTMSTLHNPKSTALSLTLENIPIIFTLKKCPLFWPHPRPVGKVSITARCKSRGVWGYRTS